MMRQHELVDRVASYTPNIDHDLLNRAYVYAMHKHRHQKRASGDPYFSHPLEVAAIVTDLRLDQDSVVAALLHDTIEDTDATRAEIDSMFGHDIGQLVDGLTKLKRIDLVSKKTRQGENLRKLLLAISEDVRVLLVKLADRLHNMRTLGAMPAHKKQRIAQETMDIYAPLAGRMGMQDLRDELEELSFQTLNPEAHDVIHEKLAKLREKSASIIAEIETSVLDNLAAYDIKAVVKSRNKRPYSVFRKMESRNISFEQLSDVIGFRVLVERVEHCYLALGAVHTRWAAVPGRFKDYISTPKQNDYRSLHTTIVGPSRQRVELQIRTHEMNDIAEYGIAVHALYKDGIYSAPETTEASGSLKGLDASESRAYSWLRRTVENLSEGDHPDDVLEHTRLELFHDQVFCFTPKGRLIALPNGATAIDFAYAVHTDVGNSCVGCRINGQASPVVTKLRNGDEVHVIRSEGHTPPLAWENVVMTGKARAGIRRATRVARQKQYLGLGEKILTATFRRANHDFDAKKLAPVLSKLAYSRVEDAIAAVGRGEVPPEDVLKAVFPDYQKERSQRGTGAGGEGWFNMTGVANIMFRIPGLRNQKHTEAARDVSAAIPISGAGEGLPVSIDPEGGAVPGDRIVGILTPGEGITVYPIQATALQKFEDSADQWLDLRWDIDEDNPARFPAKVALTAVNSPGVLAEISDLIARTDANIANLYVASPEQGLTQMTFGVEVWDLKHLNRLLSELRGLDVVNSVERHHD
ncbi:RelA/SpoT family protein [Pseudahrensia aquimaris]|uniref:GTP pyrophosphokinase rsh n=1 Tax=Pseudahrensia aquimaris TaxID=744461 RepID=A0ABW3FDW0_9HYPH